MRISEMQEKINKKSFVFLENGPSSCCMNFDMFRPEYLSSVVNVLTSSGKISDQTIADFVHLNLPRIHEKIS